MYNVIILPKALEDFSKFDKAIAQRISDKLTWLSEVIEDATLLPLKGKLSGFYKLKNGDWRVIYAVSNILPQFKNSVPVIRGDAAYLLGIIGHKNSLSLLEELSMKGENADVRLIAKEAIEDIRNAN